MQRQHLITKNQQTRLDNGVCAILGGTSALIFSPGFCVVLRELLGGGQADRAGQCREAARPRVGRSLNDFVALTMRR